MTDDAELQEYFALVNVVSEFDQRVLTVKSWGVTLSLAALGLGFHYGSYGMFLVAAASSLAFWSLEGVMKRIRCASIRECAKSRWAGTHALLLMTASIQLRA